MNQEVELVILAGARFEDASVTLDHRALEFHLGPRRGVRFHTFSSLMLSPTSDRATEESYEFTGPRLGLYHEIADPREGPVVNHFVERLEIRVTYPALDLAAVTVKAWADFSKSYFDQYWYKGPAMGHWTFEASVMYKFPRI